MKLIEKYQNFGIFKAGELLLSPKDAIRLIEDLEQKGLLIIGVDLWYYIDDKIAEDFSFLDLSEINDVKASAAIAKRFITNQLPQRTAFVSLVLEEE